MSGKRIFWCIAVTETLDSRLEQYIQKDSFKTKSEFVRNAVRLALEKAEVPKK